MLYTMSMDNLKAVSSVCSKKVCEFVNRLVTLSKALCEAEVSFSTSREIPDSTKRYILRLIDRLLYTTVSINRVAVGKGYAPVLADEDGQPVMKPHTAAALAAIFSWQSNTLAEVDLLFWEEELEHERELQHKYLKRGY